MTFGHLRKGKRNPGSANCRKKNGQLCIVHPLKIVWSGTATRFVKQPNTASGNTF